jgi:hypothetical protein
MDNSIAIYNRDDQGVAAKIKMLLPYGQKLTDNNALALAAYSRLHGLDPFNGECYFLVREKKNDRGDVTGREEMGVYPGIKALRKMAKQQLQHTDRQAHYKVNYETIDPANLGIDPSGVALCVMGTLWDSISTGHYIINVVKLSGAKYTKEEIEAMIGKSPTWVGYGVVLKRELGYIKMSPMALAKKRAEADCTKQRFDLPFSTETAEEVPADEGGIGEEIEGVMTDVTPPHKDTEQLLAELGYEVTPEPEPALKPIIFQYTNGDMVDMLNKREVTSFENYLEAHNGNVPASREALRAAVLAAGTQPN